MQYPASHTTQTSLLDTHFLFLPRSLTFSLFVCLYTSHMYPYPIRTLTTPNIAEVTSNEIPRGPANIGNTCYINCILQALNTIPMLVEHFLLGRHMDDIIPDGHLSSMSKDSSMSEAFTNVIRHLRFPTTDSSFVPTSFQHHFLQRCPHMIV